MKRGADIRGAFQGVRERSVRRLHGQIRSVSDQVHKGALGAPSVVEVGPETAAKFVRAKLLQEHHVRFERGLAPECFVIGSPTTDHPECRGCPVWGDCAYWSDLYEGICPLPGKPQQQAMDAAKSLSPLVGVPWGRILFLSAFKHNAGRQLNAHGWNNVATSLGMFCDALGKSVMVPALREFILALKDPARPWIPCQCCENLWCVEHESHAFECPCRGRSGDGRADQADRGARGTWQTRRS